MLGSTTLSPGWRRQRYSAYISAISTSTGTKNAPRKAQGSVAVSSRAVVRNSSAGTKM